MRTSLGSLRSQGSNVRPVRPADGPAWLEMRRRLWPGSEHAREIAHFFAGNSRNPMAVLLATDENGASGFVELSIRPYAEGCKTERVAYLEGWFVMPYARGRGVGRALIAASEEWALSQGCTELASDTEVDNKVSAAAHLALGFVDRGVVRCFSKKLRKTPSA